MQLFAPFEQRMEPPLGTPYISSTMQIEPGWIDYNGHMNMAFYSVLFDRAGDEMYDRVGLGPDYQSATGATSYTAEFHICYLREMHLGQSVRVHTWLLDRDEKRFHLWQEIWHGTGDEAWCAATGETLALHVDQSGPRVVPMPAEVQARFDAFAEAHGLADKPDRAGRIIGIRH